MPRFTSKTKKISRQVNKGASTPMCKPTDLFNFIKLQIELKFSHRIVYESYR